MSVKKRTPVPLCLSCSSTLLPRSKSGIDLKDSTYTTPCCSSPICTRCLNTNPRLRDYNPCLWCASGVGAMASGSKTSLTKTSKQVEAEEQDQADDRFEIGDDSDLEDEIDGDAPPPYEAKDIEPACQRDLSQQTIRADQGLSEGDELRQAREMQEADERAIKEHVVCKGDTVRSLALKYNLDPYDLITLNKLPHSAMHMSPNLLQTRKTVLISQPRPDRGQQGGNEREDEQRTRERQVKRFQILTKTPDPGIAKAYLAVQNIDDSISLSDPSSILFNAFEGDYESATQADKPSEAQSEAEKKPASGKGKGKGKVTIEGRAVDRYYSDEEWAARAAEETRDEAERKRQRGGFAGLKGILGVKQDKSKSPAVVKKGNYIQGAPWIESR